ncbi:MAG: hypothetical protein AAGF94_12935 [Pseudomonadota bacterium]
MKDLSTFIDELIAAHSDRRTFEPAGLIPSTVDEAYAVHEALMEALGPVEGFKISQKPNRPPVVAPIPNSRCLPSGAQLDGPTKTKVEVELGFVVFDVIPDPGDADFRRRLMSAVRPAPMIEIVASRLEGAHADDPMAKLADLQSCEALIFGSADEEWSGSEFDEVQVELNCDGAIVSEGLGKIPAGTAYDALERTVIELGHRFGGLQVGQKLLTGSLLSPIEMTAGHRLNGRIKGLSGVTVDL